MKKAILISTAILVSVILIVFLGNAPDTQKQKSTGQDGHSSKMSYPISSKEEHINVIKTLARKGDALDSGANIKVSNLPVSIVGIVTGEKKNTFAVVRNKKNGIIKYVRAGDSLYDHTISSIIRQGIILSDGETLKMIPFGTAEKRKDGTITKITLDKNSAAFSDEEKPLTTISNLKEDFRPAWDHKPSLFEPDAKNKINKAVDDYSGEVIGLKVVSVAENDFFSKLNLKEGDIIQGINGIPTDSFDRVQDILSELPKKNTKVTIDILREDDEISFTFVMGNEKT
jgi:hypothetical protein